MKTKLSILLVLLVLQGAIAQNYQSVEELDNVCTQLGFKSNEDAEIAVDRILSEIGLARNFIILECPDINNAVAKNIEDENGDLLRYILYDNSFFSSINDKASNDWAATSILAHEIGHHLSGHALNNKGSNHKWELEADEFSGFILAKMGATLEETQSGLMTIRYEKATHTHPAKKDRLERAKAGWDKANRSNAEEKYDPVEEVSMTIVENAPIYPGCKGSNAELNRCLNQNIGQIIGAHFDGSLANTLGLQKGKMRILLQFTINKYGMISNVGARAPHPKLEAEAIRVIRLIPPMQPGEQRGKTVNIKYALPITLNVE